MAAVLTTLLLVLSLAGLVIAAAVKQPTAYAAISGLSGLVLFALAIASQYRLEAAHAGRAQLASSAARHIAFVWIMGALALLFVYGFILSWREWLTFTVAMMVAGGLSYGLSVLFAGDAARKRTDEAMLKLGRTLNMVQVGGMIIAMAGLVIDGKMAVALTGSRSDWAANSTFFCGALTIALIGAWSLMTDRRAMKATATPNAS